MMHGQENIMEFSTFYMAPLLSS